MLAGALLVPPPVHVAVALGQVVQHNQVQVYLLTSISGQKIPQLDVGKSLGDRLSEREIERVDSYSSGYREIISG